MRTFRRATRFVFLFLIFAGLIAFVNLFKSSSGGLGFFNKARADVPTDGGVDTGGTIDSGGCSGSAASSAASCGSGDACIAKGTSIDLVNGTKKPIEEITSGEKVLAFSFRDSRVVGAEVLELLQHSPHDHPELIILEDGQHTLTLTTDHHIMTHHGWIAAGELSVGTEISVLQNGSIVKTQIQKLRKEQIIAPLYTIRTAADNYFANGILIHTERPSAHIYDYRQPVLKTAIPRDLITV